MLVANAYRQAINSRAADDCATTDIQAGVQQADSMAEGQRPQRSFAMYVHPLRRVHRVSDSAVKEPVLRKSVTHEATTASKEMATRNLVT